MEKPDLPLAVRTERAEQNVTFDSGLRRGQTAWVGLVSLRSYMSDGPSSRSVKGSLRFAATSPPPFQPGCHASLNSPVDVCVPYLPGFS